MERAPLLLVFGDLAERVAALLRVRPGLIPRLVVAPREVIHSVSAYLYLAPEATQPDEVVAAAIDESHARDLLHAAMPNHPPRLFRALDRAGDRVPERRFFERLGAVCRGPYANALLEGGRIDDARLAHFEALSRMDPALTGLHEAIQGDTYLAEAVDCMIALLRARGALRDGDLRLQPKAGTPALTRRLRAALGRVEVSDPGFSAPAPFRLVSTADELQRIGKALGNCVAVPHWNAAQHHVSLVQGAVVFLVSDEPPLLASLVSVAERVWYLQELCGPQNAAPPSGMRANLIRDLTAAGQRIVMVDPQAALGRLTQERRRRRAAIEDDLGEEEDEDEGEDVGGIAA